VERSACAAFVRAIIKATVESERVAEWKFMRHMSQ
jgi:hypothetical protein